MAKDEILTAELRSRMLEEIQAFMDEERGETIGLIAAQNILDFFLEKLGKPLCGEMLKRYRESLQWKMEDTEVEILQYLS